MCARQVGPIGLNKPFLTMRRPRIASLEGSTDRFRPQHSPARQLCSPPPGLMTPAIQIQFMVHADGSLSHNHSLQANSITLPFLSGQIHPITDHGNYIKLQYWTI